MNAQHGNLRARILKEAARLFVLRGYHGISMREIAAAVGISKAGLYYHFQDKEHLLLALLRDHLARIETVLIDAAHAGETTREQVGALLHGIFALSPEQRAVIRLASQEVGQLGPVARAEFNRLYAAQFTGRVEAILQAGIERGELRPVNPGVAAWLLLGMAYPLLYPASVAHVENHNAVITLMITAFFDGLAAASS